MSGARLEIDLPGTRHAPGMARRALLRHVKDAIGEHDCRTLELLVSELVTNAVRHTGPRPGPVRLVIDWSGPHVRVEVHDQGPGFRPSEPRPLPGGEGGYGLVLVERMADRWGVGGHGGSQVWFELRPGAA